MTKIYFKKLDEKAVMPTYGSEYAAGADLYACMDEAVVIEPGQTEFIHTGIAIELPMGTVGLVYARSGLACKKGLAPANKVGVIDCDYRGELMVALHNHSDKPITVEPKERIAQLVIMPYICGEYIETEELSDTVRGSGGFGSTGTK
ncbi:MAG: dUTP diphosphatase [Lachnospiraceae bacterium]|nr:dUTP diphosphatase [Lachnospiraceae bacterium]